MCGVILLFRAIKWSVSNLCKCFCTVCPVISGIVWKCISSIHWVRYVGFVLGFLLGQLYYQSLLTKIPFPDNVALSLNLGISFLLGIGNSVCRQLRCISLLTFPMYCGKPGRGVLKAVVLTYVIAGPITNMGYNAKEVVRVFACSTQLFHNLSRTKHSLMNRPFKLTVGELRNDMYDVKDTLRSIRDVAAPIEREMLDKREINISRRVNDYIDKIFPYGRRRSDIIEEKYGIKAKDTKSDMYQKNYLKKLDYRCQDQVSMAVRLCVQAFEGVYGNCNDWMPWYATWALCWPFRITYVCNFMHIIGAPDLCDSQAHVDPGLGEGFLYFEKAKDEVMSGFKDVKLQYKIYQVQELIDTQDAKETGERVMHAFEEKHIIMQKAIDFVNVCVALLFLRIIVAAGTYHDLYLTSIGHDNVYITGYFKKLDNRRRRRNKCNVLPLNKMERCKYIDVHSLAYTAERNKIVTQILKVMLEMITATTFVMLDRLFYEALDVVRQHAEMEVYQDGEHDLEIEVKGTGVFARVVRTLLSGLRTRERVHRRVTNRPCLPRPRSMPPAFYFKIYGGYVWILLLLYFNPYTRRLRRLICSWFYPRREKQRILHLYNDILKKRVKMRKTLHRKAVQSIRAHYLSGENLLSLRVKFPKLLGWMKVFPAARMTCLICGETEPRHPNNKWSTCPSRKCPFVYCEECWLESGERCLACDPSLAEISNVDSLSEDEQPRY